MGLRLALEKDKNKMYFDFPDAYWAIENVIFSYDLIDFSLRAFPSRESKLANNQILSDPTIGFGSGSKVVNSILYEWHVRIELTDIFPSGAIPAGKDAQYTAIYRWIKAYTDLPFEDVLEE